MFDEARAIKSTMELCHLTQSELAAQLGVSQSYVANKLRLLRFSEKMTEKIRASGITERHARSLLRLLEREEAASGSAASAADQSGSAASNTSSTPTAEEHIERILAEICDRALTVRECEALIDSELVRKIPHRLGRATALDSIAALRSAITSACTTLQSQGINARSRASYLGSDLYITVVIKEA